MSETYPYIGDITLDDITPESLGGYHTLTFHTLNCHICGARGDGNLGRIYGLGTRLSRKYEAIHLWVCHRCWDEVDKRNVEHKNSNV